MKKFIVTVDTEADNQWDINERNTTINADYIPRFQELSEEYGFRPVYLIDYDMAQSTSLQKYLVPKESAGKCEIGMHLHAWTTPPFVALDEQIGNRPYLIEYPEEIMERKIAAITDMISSSFYVKPVSHRAGRWAINYDYMRLIEKYGYKVDCSVTPHINWSKSLGRSQGAQGSNYFSFNIKPDYIYDTQIYEVPMSILKCSRIDAALKSSGSLKQKIKCLLLGQNIWLRPAISSLDDMKYLIEHIQRDDSVDYLEFMVHSSELMPGGSPYFANAESIEMLYMELETLFAKVSQSYEGCSLKSYNVWRIGE